MKTIKRLLIFGVLAMSLFAGFAQKEQLEPNIHNFTFKKDPTHFWLLADGHYLVSHFPSQPFHRGSIQVHDTHTGEFLYDLKLPYEYHIFHTKDFLLLNSNGMLTNYDVRTGEKQWTMEMKTKRLLWNDEKYLLLTESLSDEQNYSRLYCIEISSRKLLAATVVNLWDGIEYIEATEDGMLYIWSDELFKINLHDGKCNQIKTKTQVVSGKKLAANIGLSMASVAANVASAAMTGYIYVPIGQQSTSKGLLCNNNITSSHISNLSSQILTDQGRHYVADREYVRCLDSALQVIWETQLPQKRASMSSLKLTGDTLVMANLGMGLLGGYTPRATGRPFVATFDRNDGHCIFYHELADERSMHLQNMISEVQAISMDKDSLFIVSLNDSLVKTVRWNKSEQGDFVRMSNDSLTFAFNSETGRFNSLGIGTDCVITSKNEAYRVSVDKDPKLLGRDSVLYSGLSLDKDLILLEGLKDHQDHWITDSAGVPLYHFAEPITLLAVSPTSVFFQSITDKSYHVACW